MKRLAPRLPSVLLGCAVLLTGCTGGAAGDGAEDRAALGDQPGEHSNRGDPGVGAAPPSGPKAAAPDRRSGEEQAAEDSRLAPEPDLLSTFALDVDTASYGYALRALGEGRLPEPGTVRPEEFVNSFRQDYPRPDGDGFSVTVDGARTGNFSSSRWSLMRVGLATRAAGDRDGRRAPAALTFVVDVSGSMAEPGRLDLVRESLLLMIDRLRSDDSVAVVAFSEKARTVLPMTRLGAPDRRAGIRRAVSGLQPRSRTDLGRGLEAGYRQAVEGRREGATNRVVLLSDALANTGDTQAETLLERIGTARREQGITLFGVGVGSEYGDRLMERLSNEGDGHTSYVSTREQARKVFVEQLPRNVELRARDAKAQVAFDPETVETFRLIGYENRAVADQDFRDDRVDGGEVGPGHTVTALYAVRLREKAGGPVATATVRWLDPDSRTPHEADGTIRAAQLHDGLWQSPPRLQLTAVAAYFADALRAGGVREPGAAIPGAPPLTELADRARGIAARTEDKAVAELARSIDQAGRLGARPAPRAD